MSKKTSNLISTVSVLLIVLAVTFSTLQIFPAEIYGEMMISNSVTSVTCSPNSVARGSLVNCTATVSGLEPTGTVTWTTSSATGSFGSPNGTLFAGSCLTSYIDNSTGIVTIKASYSGDANNYPSSGTTVLTVFVNVTTGLNVTVQPTADLELTFAYVTTPGYVVANATPTVKAPILNNTVGLYYNIVVTAIFSGNVNVSRAFDGSNMTEAQKNSLTMMQYTPILGDINGDGTVDIFDALILSAHFGQQEDNPLWYPDANLSPIPDGGTGKQAIDIFDAILLAGHFAQTTDWVNITLYVNTTSNIIYGQTTHFSFIGVH